MLAVRRLAQFVVGFGVLVVTFCVTFPLAHSPLFRLFSPVIPMGCGFLSHLARVMQCIETKGGNGRLVDSLKIENGYYLKWETLLQEGPCERERHGDNGEGAGGSVA